MRTRSILPIMLGILFMFIVIANCTTTMNAISDEDFFRVWRGVWVSEENQGIGIIFHKTIFYPDGSYDFYYEINDAVFCDTTKFTFDQKWTDSEGNIWYAAHWENDHYAQGCSMGKFSNDGNTYEEVWKFGDEPIEKWTPAGGGYFYFMWYRIE